MNSDSLQKIVDLVVAEGQTKQNQMRPGLIIVTDGKGRHTRVCDGDGRYLREACAVEVDKIVPHALVRAKVTFSHVALVVVAHEKPILSWRYM